MKTNLSLSRFSPSMNYTTTLGCILLGVLSLEFNANGAALVTYDISTANAAVSTTVTPTTDPNVTAGNLGFTGVGAPLSLAGTFAASGWGTSASADTGKYFEFTVAPTAGNQITFTSLGGSLFRGRDDVTPNFADHGADTWELRSSADGFASSIGGSLDISPALSGQQVQFLFNVSGLGTTAGSTTFRLYGYNETGVRSAGLGNTGSLPGTGSNLILSGTVSAVPEPEVTAGVVALGLLGFAMARKKLSRRAV